MARRPTLSKAEMEVARIVWDLGEATVRQVFEALPQERKIDFNTVQTYLRRLHTKGYLGARRRGRTMVYRARVEPDQVIGETVRDLVNRLFDGQMIPLVHYLIRDRSTSDQEIRQLRAMLKQWEREQREDKDHEHSKRTG